jgi:ABC-type multidrug transport system fused ATPase/permease subunit
MPKGVPCYESHQIIDNWLKEIICQKYSIAMASADEVDAGVEVDAEVCVGEPTAKTETASRELHRLDTLKNVGLDDPLKPREGRDLVWRNINMTVKGRGDKQPKKILDGVWGEVPKGQITAIMGPSGSGKVSRWRRGNQSGST